MLLEGLQLGRYHLLRLLGSGGMGEVYLGEDTHIRRQIAIKVIRSEASPYPNNSAAKEATRLFQRELRAIAMLDHPHILPLFDYGEENLKETALTYMVMPLRLEGSLATWLRQRSGPELPAPEDVAHFIRQAATGLQYAHRHSIIHQDVKPSNFLIRSDEEHPNRPDLLLADFGIAKVNTATASVSQTSRGTPTYMAPEQWSGQPVPATDQYALAIMAYQLLTGSPPFQGRQEQVMYLHFNAQPQPPSTVNPGISAAVDAVILHALAKKPEDRFPSISDFARALQKALQGAEPAPATKNLNPPTSPASEDLRATLAISKAEAHTGTTRTLTLPRGRRIMVPVPSGIPNGQVIRLEGQGEPSGSGQIGALVITIAIADNQEPVLVSETGSDEESTFLSKAKEVETIGLMTSATRNGRITRLHTNLRLRLPRGRAALFIALALLVVLGSLGFFYFRYYNVISRISLLNAGLSNPYTSGGTLALNDPLSDNSNGYFWGEGSNGQGICEFTGGAYHASISQQGSILYCTPATNFNNFAFQVQMTIVRGDEGGIIFRADDTKGTYYYFRIGQDGTYDLTSYDGPRSSDQRLTDGTSTAIHSGLNQTNLIAVVAKGSSITLYVNGQIIGSMSDSTYSQGEIGVAADDVSNPTEVVFSNAKVWTF